MTNIISLFLAFLITINISCHQQFQQYIDKWNYIAKIQGQFDKNHTLFEKAQCDPCDYLIIVYKDYIQLLIDDPQPVDPKNPKNKIKAFQFQIQQHHYTQNYLDFDLQTMKIKIPQTPEVKESLIRFAKNGLQWKYQLTLPIQGLILKSQTKSYYQYLIGGISLLFSVLIFLFFPLNQNSRKQILRQIPRRTPLMSILILSQIQHMILIQITIIAIKYLIYQQSFLMKSFWYALFMVPFGFIILQILYLYDSVRTSYYNTLEKVPNSKIKDFGLLLVYFFFIYWTVGTLCLLRKDITIFAYFSLYLLIQIVWSLWNRVYPYMSLTLYFTSLLAYQMFLSNCEPILWFELNTFQQIGIFWGGIVVLFLIGAILQKLIIGIQIVNQVLFQQSKSFQMKDPSIMAAVTQQQIQKDM